MRPAQRGDRTDYSSDELAHVVPSVAHSLETVATITLGLKRRVPPAPVNQRLDGVADGPGGAISVWTLAPTGAVVLDTAAVEPVLRYAIGWIITVDAGVARRIVAMREARVPSETGGILFSLVDIPARRIHLVDATPAPPGSIEEPGGFVRGMGGVDKTMEDVRRRTAGQVRYVGEWHSHPPRASARPSPVDSRQLDWLAAVMGMDSMPVLMVIAADSELAVIFASQWAEPVPRQKVA